MSSKGPILTVVGIASIAVGVGLLALGLLVDVVGLGGGDGGIGTRQLLVIAAGIGAIAVGAWLRTERAGAWLARQRTPPTDVTPWTFPPVAGLAIGLATGLLEGAIVTFRSDVLGHFVWLPRDVVWMAPISYAAVFLLLGLALSLAAVALPRLRGASVSVGLLSFVAVVCLILMLRRIHVLASVLLAAGLVAQLGRWRRIPSGHRLARLVSRSLLPLGATTLLLGLGLTVGRGALSRWTLARLPAAAPGSPNVVLIVLDTVRSSSLSLYGYPRPTTPRLEELATHGIVFDNAFSTAPWTLPSHASMFTGEYPHALSTNWLEPLDDRPPTLAERFRRAGYATAGFSANLHYTGHDSGLDRGFVHYESYERSPRQVFLSTTLGQRFLSRKTRFTPFRTWFDRRLAPSVTRGFLHWLTATRGRPFFAFLNYYEAHEPYRFDPEMGERFDDGTQNGRYDAAIASVDAELGSLVDQLELRDLLSNTIVVVASDHGQHLGDHGLIGHGNSLYLPLLHVPLVILPGAGVVGSRVADAVTLRDLPATLLDMAGVPDSLRLPGNSMARFWDAEERGGPISYVLSEVREGVTSLPEEPVSRGDMRSLIRHGMHLIQNGDGAIELYDLRHDPSESDDLAGEPSRAKLVRELTTLLDAAASGSDLREAGGRRETDGR